MSYYLFEQGGIIWRSVCSGAVNRTETFSVLAMVEARRDAEGIYHGQSADASAYPDSFSAQYVSLLYYLFGCRRPAYLTPIQKVQPRGLLHDEFPHPYAFTLHAKVGGVSVPMATRHACWQILRQIAYRPKNVKEVVSKWGKLPVSKRSPTTAAELWYDGVVDGERSENFSYVASRGHFVNRLAQVLSGDDDGLCHMDVWSSQVFSDYD